MNSFSFIDRKNKKPTVTGAEVHYLALSSEPTDVSRPTFGFAGRYLTKRRAQRNLHN